MAQLMCGISNGKRWIAGEVPVKRNISVHLDTRTGEGIEVILREMEDTITWHASRMKIPSNNQEDLEQELRLIVLLAIPDFDITKETNFCTFLQNHLRKRIINIYKHATEQCRTPVHENYRICKVKCPKCKKFTMFDAAAAKSHICQHCGHKESGESKETWKTYPIAITTISSSQTFRRSDAVESGGCIQDFISPADLSILGKSYKEPPEELLDKTAIMEVWNQSSDGDRLILEYLLQGYNVREICSKTNLTDAMVKLRIRRLGAL